MTAARAAGALPIVASGVGFRYEGAARRAIEGIDLRLDAGEVLAIVGPSGSGKSTLARAIAGLIPRDTPGEWTGTLKVGDLDVSTAEPAAVAERVGILFQDPDSQLVMERVEDDVAFGLENRAWPLAAMRARVPGALGAAGLGGYQRRQTTRLSGGEQQRVALAGVEAPWPAVLVLDEPTANLDPAGAAALFERLTAIRDARRATIVLVEHRADLAWPLADQVLALDAEGRPLAHGAPASVARRHGRKLAEAGIWLPSDFDGAGPRRLSGASLEESDVIEIRHAFFEYEPGSPVVRDIDLGVAAGERVALVGANGSGKSTLLRLAAGLLKPRYGSIHLAGLEPARLPSARLARLCGYVFQDPELGFLADTVEEEITLGLPVGPATAARELLERMHLPIADLGARSPYRLSGGEQRRLSVATALARRPAALLLDEPTFGQDRLGWEALASILDELVEQGTAVLTATHDERFAARVADRRVEMAEGWIIADDGPGRAAEEPLRAESA